MDEDRTNRRAYTSVEGAYSRPEAVVTLRTGAKSITAMDAIDGVHLDGPVDTDLAQLAAAALSRATVPRLTVTGLPDTDLAFLRDLPPLTELRVVSCGVRDLEPLAHHRGSLIRVVIDVGEHVVDLTPLGALDAMRELYVHKTGRSRVSGLLEAISLAGAVEHLALHSLTLPTLEPLTRLPRLRALALKLGGTSNIDSIPAMPALRGFEAWQVRGLEDLRPIAASQTLEVLYLESLRRASLPDFSDAAALQHVQIHNVPLTDGIAGLAAAPSLRQVIITGGKLTADQAEVLRTHPTLEVSFVHRVGRCGPEDYRLGRWTERNNAPFVAFGAGVMGLPPEGWNGEYYL